MNPVFVQTQLLATGNRFLLVDTPSTGSMALYLNGLFLTQNVDYTLLDNAITLLHKTVGDGDVLTAWYMKPITATQ